MNRKVVKTLIILTIAYLCAWYILKIFFPEMFVLQVNNEKLIKIGEFIDNHIVIDKIIGAITSYITYWLYLGAICKIKRLNLVQSIIVIAAYIGSFIIELINIELCTYYNIIVMIVLPAIFDGELKRTAFVFSFHLICQWLSLSIRSLSTQILSFNILTALIMGLESYFWLFLFYLLFNYYDKKEN